MEKTKLSEYAVERLKSGLSPELVKQHLLIVGWSEEEASAAIVAALVQNGVPAPEHGASSGRNKLASTVEIVLNLFSFLLLATVAIALGVLYYQVINKFLPDALSSRYGYPLGFSASTIHYSIAALVVAFPLYAYVVYLWFKRFREDVEKVESKLTKWLTYIVLLIAAVTIVGDLITSVFYLLQGELSMRFVLKAGTILIISGSIFGFYFLERKKIQYRREIPRSIFQYIGWAVGGYVLLGLLLGFFAGGSPATQRDRTLDAERANNLRELAGCISNYVQTTKQLPADISDLAKSGQYGYCASADTDPETGTAYEYHPIGAPELNGEVVQANFELCATFALPNDDNTTSEPYSYPQNDKWAVHGAGRACDTETVTIVETLNGMKPVPAVPYMM